MSEKKKRFKIRNSTVFRDVIKHKAETIGDKKFLTFIRDFDKDIDETYTYKDVHVFSNRLGNGLFKLGLKKGDGIALMEINSPEFLFAVSASFKIGTYVVLVNTSLRGDGLKFIIEHSEAKAIIINHAFLPAFLEIRDQLKEIKRIIVDVNETPDDFKLPEGTISLQEVMEAPDDDIEVEISIDDLAMLMYTAGTTGLPKAVTFWQGKLLGGYNLKSLATLVGFITRKNDILFTCLPLFHSNGLFLTTLAGYLAELPVILSKRFSASRHWAICRKYNVTCFNALGAMIPILMKQPESPLDKQHKVTQVNSSACPKEVWEAFETRFNVPLNEAYGATDSGGFMLVNLGAEKPPVGAMGKPVLGVKASILDDNGNHLGPNEVGELVFEWRDSEAKRREVKYFKNVEASKKLIIEDKDGKKWFSTGDLAYRDENGWYYFVDRKRDAIRRRGENIAAYSIENIINQHDKILEAAAFGVKSEPITPSLKVITRELNAQYNHTPEEFDFTLTHWAKQVVLLLNTSLTVVEANPASHSHLWSKFTAQVIKKIAEYDSSIIFVLWGKHAEKYKKYIKDNRVLTSAHPAAEMYSFGRAGFFGNGHFIKINEMLDSKINWFELPTKLTDNEQIQLYNE